MSHISYNICSKTVKPSSSTDESIDDDIYREPSSSKDADAVSDTLSDLQPWMYTRGTQQYAKNCSRDDTVTPPTFAPNPSVNLPKLTIEDLYYMHANLSREPVRCPIGSCKRIVGCTTLLHHYFHDHSSDIMHERMFDTETCCINFTISDMICENHNYCLVVLFYGGRRNAILPPTQWLWHKSVNISGDTFETYLELMPIFLMVCKTTIKAFNVEEDSIYNISMTEDVDLKSDNEREDDVSNSDNEREDDVSKSNNKEDNVSKSSNKEDDDDSKSNNEREHDDSVLVIWCVGIDTSVPIKCSLTVHNTVESMSCSKLVNLRNFRHSQDPNVFLASDPNCLVMTVSHFNELQNSGEPIVNVEFSTLCDDVDEELVK